MLQARERKQTRSNSGADSTVWMEECVFYFVFNPWMFVYNVQGFLVCKFLILKSGEKMNTSELYMHRAIEVAKSGWGRTNPNPLVGAVIVKNDKVIAEGYHRAIGRPHAEIEAIDHSAEDVRGSTLYVNLEPCSRYGRTPPCVKAIIDSGIKKVVVAMEDPNPQVSGEGIRILREAGIDVVTGILETEAKKLNEIFIKYITLKKPYVIMKMAMTLDGKIATVSGDAKWISGESSRKYVHIIRERVAAIMVGVNTIINDDPLLTARTESGKEKKLVKIIIDGKGKISPDCKVIRTASSECVILATTSAIRQPKEDLLLEKGVQILKLDGQDGHVDLNMLMDHLYQREIDSILLEGGGQLNAVALKLRLVDKVMTFIAPKIIGGKDAKTPVEGEGIPWMKEAIELRHISIQRFDDDTLIEGYLKGDPYCLREL